jgi:hypothetical protein
VFSSAKIKISLTKNLIHYFYSASAQAVKGSKIMDTDRKHSHVSVTGGLHAKLKARAEQDGISMTHIVESVINPALGLEVPMMMKSPRSAQVETNKAKSR